MVLPKSLNQNLRQIGPGVSELRSDKQTNRYQDTQTEIITLYILYIHILCRDDCGLNYSIEDISSVYLAATSSCIIARSEGLYKIFISNIQTQIDV